MGEFVQPMARGIEWCRRTFSRLDRANDVHGAPLTSFKRYSQSCAIQRTPQQKRKAPEKSPVLLSGTADLVAGERFELSTSRL
jgi:hypothetical protein